MGRLNQLSQSGSFLQIFVLILLTAALSYTQTNNWTLLVSETCFYLGIAPRAQLLKKSTWLFHLNGDKTPPAPRDSSETVRA